MGFNNANIEKEEDEYVWRGDKNLQIYESEFEKYLIPKVSFIFLKFNYSLKRSTLRRAPSGCLTSTVPSTSERQRKTFSKKKKEQTTCCRERPRTSY